MRTILIIDESAQFREYMRLKLEEHNIEAPVAANALEGISKIKNLLPDLIILDYHLSQFAYMEVLKEKKRHPHTAKTPVIILAQQIDQKKVIELVPYNVKKVFTKPVKIDALFSTISEMLGVSFKLDRSPGVVETHVNDDIIFIEISKGLNEDKLDLLKFKIVELIELYEIRVPKVVLMLFDIKLSHADAPNMMKLIETVIHASRARLRYIRIISRDEFVRNFFKGQAEYSAIVIVDNLLAAVEGLLSSLSGPMGSEDQRAQIIGEKILAASQDPGGESIALHFEADSKTRSLIKIEMLKEIVQKRRIAVVDDDFVVRELIQNTFKSLGAEVKAYTDGAEYLAVLETEAFDLVFLDLLMPQVDGFQVLRALQVRNDAPPVIVLSSVTQRETMIRAFEMGIKSYLPKPMKPADIFKKALEILRPSL